MTLQEKIDELFEYHKAKQKNINNVVDYMSFTQACNELAEWVRKGTILEQQKYKHPNMVIPTLEQIENFEMED